MEKKLSIIVPIYKVEKYLCKCIDSLLNQDLPRAEYEIILVDDGSPDKCGEMADKYSARYDNIRVIHRENGGLGAARNTGIAAANGTYIQFVDSDDYLEANVLSGLVDRMTEENLDVLRFNYRNVGEDYREFYPNKEYRPFVDYSTSITDGLTFLTERLGYACYACQFIIKKSLLSNNRILFREGIYYEDTEWTPRMLTCARRVSSTDLIIYNYLSRDGSITRGMSVERKSKVLEDKLMSIDILKEQMKDATDKRWYEGMVSSTVLSVVGYLCSDFYFERKKVIDRLEAMSVFPISSFHIAKRAVWKLRLINASPSLYCMVVRTLHRIW